MTPLIRWSHGEGMPDPRRTHAGPNSHNTPDIELFNLSKTSIIEEQDHIILIINTLKAKNNVNYNQIGIEKAFPFKINLLIL